MAGAGIFIRCERPAINLLVASTHTGWMHGKRLKHSKSKLKDMGEIPAGEINTKSAASWSAKLATTQKLLSIKQATCRPSQAGIPRANLSKNTT